MRQLATRNCGKVITAVFSTGRLHGMCVSTYPEPEHVLTCVMHVGKVEAAALAGTTA